MKKLNLFTLSIVSIMTFSSCQQNEIVASEQSKCAECAAESYKSDSGEIGTLAKGKAFGRELTYRKIDGLNVFEGDILLTQEQLDAPHTEGTHTNQAAVLWPNRTIAYNWSTTTTQATKDKFLAAAKNWSDNLGFTFVRRTNQTNYILVTSASGCSSFIGMIGGRQEMKLGSTCSVGNAIHEIGHAVGLFHEQSRRDRDTYVTINRGNIEAGLEGNFDVCGNCVANGTLDFGSIMMYGSFFFSRNGQPTITRKNGTTFDVQRNGLSANDKAIVNSRYR
jgi:hypothetical protein